MKEIGEITKGHQQYFIKQSFKFFALQTQSFHLKPFRDYHTHSLGPVLFLS